MISITSSLMLELCNIEQNLIILYIFYSNFDDTYQIFGIRLTEQFVTVGSITLRFYVFTACYVGIIVIHLSFYRLTE